MVANKQGACRLTLFWDHKINQTVMAGLVPAIHAFASPREKTWMPGIKPGMTTSDFSSLFPSIDNGDDRPAALRSLMHGVD
jgi:hypothetical protein